MSTELIILITQALLRYGPEAARELVTLFSKPAPTLADWELVFAKAEKSYDDYTKPKPVILA